MNSEESHPAKVIMGPGRSQAEVGPHLLFSCGAIVNNLARSHLRRRLISSCGADLSLVRVPGPNDGTGRPTRADVGEDSPRSLMRTFLPCLYVYSSRASQRERERHDEKKGEWERRWKSNDLVNGNEF